MFFFCAYYSLFCYALHQPSSTLRALSPNSTHTQTQILIVRIFILFTGSLFLIINSDCDSGVSEPPLVIDLSSNEGCQEGEQGQMVAEQGDGWTRVGRNGRAVRHQNPPRPKFKLGSLGDHETAYQAITALEEEYPALRMEVRPNLKAEYVLTPKDEASATFLRRLAEEGNRVLLLDPNLRRHKVVLQR